MAAPNGRSSTPARAETPSARGKPPQPPYPRLLPLGSLAAAFVPPTSMQQLSRVTVAPSADIVMMAARKKNELSSGRASASRPTVGKKPMPLSPGSNYPTTKNIQKQKNGFGTFVQKFQVRTAPLPAPPRASRHARRLTRRRMQRERARFTEAPFRARHPRARRRLRSADPCRCCRHAWCQTEKGKSKYGMPIFLPSGAVNPA